MAAVVRIYEDGDRAREAYQALVDKKFSKSIIALLIPESKPEPAPAPAPYGSEDSAYQAPGMAPVGEAPAAAASADAGTTNLSRDDLSSAVKAGAIIGADARYYLDYVDRGYALLAVSPAFGAAMKAIQTMDAFAPLKLDDSMQASRPDLEFVPISQQATPLSSALGLGVLSNHRSGLSSALGLKTLSSGHSFLARMFGELGDPHYSLSSKFGMGMLSSNPAPLSSMIGLSTKSGKSGASWTRSMGFRMLSDNAAPLSGFFGIPLISGRNDSRDYAPLKHRRVIRNRAAPLSSLFGLGVLSSGLSFLSSMFAPLMRHDWTLSSKFGMGLLSSNPAPLSSLLNLKVLKDKPNEGSLLGLPLLSKNPTPLSSALGLPVLTDFYRGL